MEFENLAAFQAHVGKELGSSNWVEITQEMVNQFAESTGDHQWIHVDIERATKHSPFGGPIAHGFLTLSLASMFAGEISQVKTAKMGVNYGTNKVRFLNPVLVGSKVRGTSVLKSCEPYGENGVRSVAEMTFEIEGQEKPACVAEIISLLFE